MSTASPRIESALMSDNKKDFLRMLAARSGEYARALPSRIEGIDSLWQRMHAGDDPVILGEDLVRAAHALAGSGATFGFPEVGRLARALELQLQPVVGSAQDGPCAERIVAAIDALRLAIHEARQ